MTTCFTIHKKALSRKVLSLTALSKSVLPSARYLSLAKFFTGGSAVDELSNEHLPTGTGRGPFIELPQFQALGQPSHLLNIKVPQSSTFNIRNGSIVAINGDLSRITSEPKFLGNNTSYQELYTSTPVSLLINGTGSTKQVKNYSVLEVEKSDNWLILNDSSIIAWTGFDLSLSPHRLLHKFNSYKSSGKGTIVVSASSELFNVELKQGESMVVNPNGLVATTVGELLPFSMKNPTKIVDYTPEWVFGLIGLVKRAPALVPEVVLLTVKQKLGQAKETIRVQAQKTPPELQQVARTIRRVWTQFKDFFRLNLVVFWTKRKPIYFKVHGPGKLIIRNAAAESNGRIFTRKEIDHTP